MLNAYFHPPYKYLAVVGGNYRLVFGVLDLPVVLYNPIQIDSSLESVQASESLIRLLPVGTFP